MIIIRRKKSIIALVMVLLVASFSGFLIFTRLNKPENLINKNIESLIKKDIKSYNSTMDVRKQVKDKDFGNAVKNIKVNHIKEISREEFKKYGYNILLRETKLTEENTRIFVLDKEVEYHENILTSRDSGEIKGYYILTKKNLKWVIYDWWDF